MPSAGYGCTVKVGGVPVSATGAATTCLDAGTYTKYRINTSSRRVVSPSYGVTVYVNAAPVTAYTLDYANGILKFATPLIVTDVVTLDYYYWPLLSITEATEFSINCTRTMLDKTSFDSSGARSRMGGLFDASGSISHLTLGSDDLDPGAGSTKLLDVLTNGSQVVLEFAFPGDAEGRIFRAIAGLDRVDDAASVDGLITETLAWSAGNYGTLLTQPASMFGFDDGRTL